jgi:hypothetical protein
MVRCLIPNREATYFRSALIGAMSQAMPPTGMTSVGNSHPVLQRLRAEMLQLRADFACTKENGLSR